MRSEAVQRIDSVKQLRARQFAEDAGPLAHSVRPESYIEIDNFYTATVYDKGAEVVRMLHTIVGPEQYRKATDLYFERHDGEATTVEAFAKSFEDATGADLTQFRLWWSQAGTPVVSVETAYDPAAQTYDITMQDHQFSMPADVLEVPCNEYTEFNVVSNDLTYGFGVFRPDNSMIFQMQVVPWRDDNTIKWKFTEGGDFTIRSTEYSGPEGAQMILKDAIRVTGCEA